MRANVWEPNWERAVDALHQSGHLDKSDVARLKNSYALLRRCELVLRRYDNRSISTLPSDPDEQRKFAIRLGYNDFDAFRRDYLTAREAIHAFYQRFITPA
jgi:glutamine synthetase adenylyltransferase